MYILGHGPTQLNPAEFNSNPTQLNPAAGVGIKYCTLCKQKTHKTSVVL